MLLADVMFLGERRTLHHVVRVGIATNLAAGITSLLGWCSVVDRRRRQIT
jgi:hypothetical protein